MQYEIVKSNIQDETIKINYCNDDLTLIDSIEGSHFGTPIHRKNYPSCYRYNVVIMLAKRLLNEEREKADKFANRLHLDRKLINRIFSSDE